MGGIASSMLLSFSPTIFASGFRIFFVNDVMLLITIAALVSEIFCVCTKKNEIKIAVKNVNKFPQTL